MTPLSGQSTVPNVAGVSGEASQSDGVRGVSHAEAWSAGVLGINDNQGDKAGVGVYGKSRGTAIFGESETWVGVYGKSTSTSGGAGVWGEGNPGPGVVGRSTKWIGVYGETDGVENGPAGVWGEHKGAGTGVKAISKDGVGLGASSATNEAIHAETGSPGTAAIAAYNTNPNGTGAAIFAQKAGSQGHAGFFDGNVFVTGSVTANVDLILTNADCAEDFDVTDAAAETPDPGTVMVLGDDGVLHPSHEPYDKRVVGVISGAGDYKPGIILDKRRAPGCRKPVALLGKVYCKVDAGAGPIQVGDLLTSSGTPGHAMKAADPFKAFGAVIGKALRPLAEGQGLIPVLIALQ